MIILLTSLGLYEDLAKIIFELSLNIIKYGPRPSWKHKKRKCTEPNHKPNIVDFALSEDSDLSGQIRVFALRMKKAYGLSWERSEQ